MTNIMSLMAMSITNGSCSLFGGDWHWRITEQTEHLKKLALHSLSSGLWSRALPENSGSYLRLQTAVTANNSQQRAAVREGWATEAGEAGGAPFLERTPVMGHLSPSPTPPLSPMATAREDRHLTSVCVEKQKGSKHSLSNAIIYLAFKVLFNLTTD